MIEVVGGGLIGLAVAFELRRRGHDVRVHERGEAIRAASWAGAGMLAPYTEGLTGDFSAMCARSLALYPQFVKTLHELSGVDARLRLDGILNVAFDAARMNELLERAQELTSGGIACRVFDRLQTVKAEPALRAPLGALLVEGEGNVDNRRLGRALLAAARASGVEVIERCGTLAVECDDRRVLGIRTTRGFTPADCVVNAAGAWAAGVPGVPSNALPDVRPVKGQMLALSVPAHFITHTTWVPGAYLVPRSDGRLLVGATVEEAGFDERVTARAIHSLLGAALAAMPALADFAVTETWAGLRPATGDLLPRIGATPIAGLFNAAGHYRNGILLAPLTATLVADAIEQTEARTAGAKSPV